MKVMKCILGNLLVCFLSFKTLTCTLEDRQFLNIVRISLSLSATAHFLCIIIKSDV